MTSPFQRFTLAAGAAQQRSPAPARPATSPAVEAAGATTPKNTPAVLRFQANTVGSDFVIGDVHGAFTQVANALKAVRFNPEVDRLFVVGDLTDRGPESLRARRFLQQSWVHAVRGNHEDFWLQCYENGTPDPIVVEALGNHMRMGVEWWLKAAPDERDALVAEFRRLPLAIEIETERGTVGLVHADVPRGMDWQSFTDGLQRGEERVVQAALWGRSRITHADDTGVPGIGRIFVGHTIVGDGPKRLGNVYAIDTGAVVGVLNGDREAGRLTIANISMKTEALSAPERTILDELIDLYDTPAEPDVPFGTYAAPGGA